MTHLLRRRSLIAGLVALMLGLLLAWPRMHPTSAVLVAWDAGVLVYLAVALFTECRLSSQAVRQRAEEMDEGANAVTLGAVLASLVALTAVVLELSGGRGSAWSASLGGATVLLSWTFIHVGFAHRYAHENALRGGLIFPGEDAPDFVECLYFAFTVGMTAQVSDVTTNSSAMRRLVLLHGLLAFLFNAAIVATAVNLAAGLAG